MSIRPEDRSTHAAYVAATGENIGYAEYLALRAYWAELGGDFYGPNVEHGSMPEAKLLPLLRRLRVASAVPGECSFCGALIKTTAAAHRCPPL